MTFPVFRTIACFVAGFACFLLSAAPAKKAISPAPKQAEKPAARKIAVQPIRYIVYDKRRYVLLKDVAKYYGMYFAFTKTGAALFGQSDRVEFLYNKREGAVNGIKVYFFYPMLLRNANAYLSEYDFLKIINPVFHNSVLTPHPIRTIMIDPGHGGSDPGAPGPVLPEKHINLQLALKLKNSLKLLGFNVIMTRTGDTFPSLADRAAICRKYKPDLFISIHCNSSRSASVHGIESFAPTPDAQPSTADKSANPKKKLAAFCDNNNFRLAYEIQKALVSITRCEDRGVKHARFFVIANAVCPSILIESGFLSNKAEGTRLAYQARQNAIITAVLFGLTNYSAAIRANMPKKQLPTKIQPKQPPARVKKTR